MSTHVVDHEYGQFTDHEQARKERRLLHVCNYCLPIGLASILLNNAVSLLPVGFLFDDSCSEYVQEYTVQARVIGA